MITEIIAILEGLGYDVFKASKETTRPNEVIVLLEDVDLELESNMSYYITEYVTVFWTTEDPESIKPKIVQIVNALYRGINLSPFKLRKPLIEKLGTMYKVELLCENPEVIEI